VRNDVDALTRRPVETYRQYIHRVSHATLTARRVKLADLADHLDDATAIPPSLIRRYQNAYLMLESAPPSPDAPGIP